ncbi:MAG: hypothetical protein AAB368_17335 [bacterium]
MRLSAALILCALWAREAAAFLQTGTLLTNSASATYSAGSQGTSVTYSATAKILIANPDVYLWKDANPTYVGTTGGIVTFLICFSNGGANTAFNVTITDALPPNTYWYDATCTAPNYVQTGNVTVAGTITRAYAQNIAGPWVVGCPPNTSPMYFLRWTVSRIDIGKSECITFAASVY